MSRENWTMPAWMEPFRDLIGNTGGDPIEELMNDKTTNAFNNVIRMGIIISVESQIYLLRRLRERGVLRLE